MQRFQFESTNARGIGFKIEVPKERREIYIIWKSVLLRRIDSSPGISDLPPDDEEEEEIDDDEID